MKKLLLAVLLALALSTAHAKTIYFVENEDFRLELSDVQCTHSITDQIVDEWKKEFNAFTMYVKSKKMLQASGGRAVVHGCWSDHQELAPKGSFVWINETGATGYADKGEFESTKKDVGV